MGGGDHPLPALRLPNALAHQLPDTVERAHQRGSQFAKRAAMMTAWAVYSATVPTDAVVKPIRGNREPSN